MDAAGALVTVLATVSSDCDTRGGSSRLCPTRTVGGEGARALVLVVVLGGVS